MRVALPSRFPRSKLTQQVCSLNCFLSKLTFCNKFFVSVMHCEIFLLLQRTVSQSLNCYSFHLVSVPIQPKPKLRRPRRQMRATALLRRWPWPAILCPSLQEWRTPPGLVTNSILFCWLFTIKDQCKKCSKHTIKVCVICLWLCPGTSKPKATHLTVSFVYL